MAFWDRFKKRDDSVLPDEVKQYYQSEQRQRTGVAVLMGVAALIITVLIAAGLFYGGRFVYRQITGDDKQTAQEQAAEEQTEKSDEEEAKPDERPTGGEGQSESIPGSTEEPSPTPPAPAPSSPSLGDEPLPRTGDPGL
jgi:cytoskeletal protein RodZ